MNNLPSLFLAFTLPFFLLGCVDEDNIAEIDNPELVAVAFFEALYNEKDVEKAASVCSPKLARIIRHYKSPNAVARHMFNMSFDNVVVTPDNSGVKVREQFKDKANITLYFDGLYQEEKLKDVKRIRLIQVDDHWVIDKILKDPF